MEAVYFVFFISLICSSTSINTSLMKKRAVLLLLRLTFCDVFLTKVCSGIRNGVRFSSSPLVPVDVSQLLASSA